MQSPKNTAKLYEDYITKMQKIADVRNAAAVLNWDEETYLPEKGAGFRGRQLATLSTMAHELFADKALEDLLSQLSQSNELTSVQCANVKHTGEDYEKNKKYTPAFVHQLSSTTSECYHAWIKARKENNYALYEPSLQKMVNLKRQEAELLGYETHPYNALLDDFEKGADVNMLDTIFDQVKKELKPLLDQIKAAPQADNTFLYQHFDKTEQWDFGLELLRDMGFDFSAGRQDISEHPFTTSFNPNDVRVTTRVDEKDFGNMIWSCIHEGGHALYEQGLSEEQYGLPGGEAASLSIHESQSRLWENQVGRSSAFWKYYYPKLKNTFIKQLKDYDEKKFYQAINKVQPSLIRTEADELTYHFHVMIRYELEKKLIAGELETKDLKPAWNEMYQTYLDVKVPNDLQGVLQDIHWSHGSFGYFPTYSLGSFYAAQFFQAAKQAIPNLEQQIASGELKPLLHWLRENIHRHGRSYLSNELCEKVTGEPLNFHYFMDYARRKFSGLL